MSGQGTPGQSKVAKNTKDLATLLWPEDRTCCQVQPSRLKMPKYNVTVCTIYLCMLGVCYFVISWYMPICDMTVITLSIDVLNVNMYYHSVTLSHFQTVTLSHHCSITAMDHSKSHTIAPFSQCKPIAPLHYHAPSQYRVSHNTLGTSILLISRLPKQLQ